MGGMKTTANEAGAVAVASAIVDEEYEPGVPGRACTECHSAWPADEADEETWHHAAGCSEVVS